MKFKKITECTCVQTFDGETCISQELIAANQCEFEDMDGKPVDCPENEQGQQPYMHFNMVQPDRKGMNYYVLSIQGDQPDPLDGPFDDFDEMKERAQSVWAELDPDCDHILWISVDDDGKPDVNYFDDMVRTGEE